MDITTLAAAQESVKALFSLAKVATAATVDHELKARLIEIQAGILEAQSKLGDAQAERLDLLHQVAELRDKVRQFENAHAALDAYKLHEIDSGKFLYKYINSGPDGIDHFACPTCFDAGKVTVLQSKKTGTNQSYYSCNTCKFGLSVGPSDPARPIARRSSWANNY
jgi:predicted RNA-binding Zn-ribbon protein involved in translation (DUF1610 family)